MSRKNRRYGEHWLIRKFDLFRWKEYYLVMGWTHTPSGPWWAAQSRMSVVPYVVKQFDNLSDYKAWCRKDRDKTFKHFLKRLSEPKEGDES